MRLPLGAPVRSKPPWKRQRPDGWSEVCRQGVASWRRAPQMRWPSWVSAASTVAIHSSDQVRAQGVPRAVVVCVDMAGVSLWLGYASINMRKFVALGIAVKEHKGRRNGDGKWTTNETNHTKRRMYLTRMCRMNRMELLGNESKRGASTDCADGVDEE